MKLRLIYLLTYSLTGVKSRATSVAKNGLLGFSQQCPVSASPDNLLTRFPAKEIHASRKALQGTEKGCLRLVWETGTTTLWKVDGVDVVVEEGKDEGWAKIEQILDGE